MAGDDETPGWSDNKRLDGTMVAAALGGVWVVVPCGGRPIISLCPCCDRALQTASAARRVADHVYPTEW